MLIGLYAKFFGVLFKAQTQNLNFKAHKCALRTSLDGEFMRNDECIIKFLNKDGRVMQSFQRDKDGWFETSSKGIVRRCKAEQTLSHLLPPLAGFTKAIVKVERIPAK